MLLLTRPWPSDGTSALALLGALSQFLLGGENKCWLLAASPSCGINQVFTKDLPRKPLHNISLTQHLRCSDIISSVQEERTNTMPVCWCPK
jgi:hypothetical protein